MKFRLSFAVVAFCSGLMIAPYGRAQSQLQRIPVDSSFKAAADGEISAILVQSDSRIVIGGSFTNVNGAKRPGIARLQPDGQLDQTFDPGLEIVGPSDLPPLGRFTVQFLKQTQDGKILVGGSFTNVGGTTRTGIARLNPDGTSDPAFSPPQQLWGILAVQPDGKIITASPVARLNLDGTSDPTFAPHLTATDLNTGSPPGSLAAMVQPDGKIVVALEWLHVVRGDIAVVSLVVRLNPEGGFDPGFRRYDASGSISCVALQPDGRILLGGKFFDLVDGTAGFVRLNPDGTVDASFKSNAGTILNFGAPFFQIRSLTLQPDGKIVFAGHLANASGFPGAARLNFDGTFDESFGSALMTSSTDYFPLAEALAVQPDGALLVAGAFASLDGVAVHNIVRINRATVAPRIYLPRRVLSTFAAVVPTLPNRSYALEFQSSAAGTNWLPAMSAVLGDGTPHTLNDTNAVATERIYRLRVN